MISDGNDNSEGVGNGQTPKFHTRLLPDDPVDEDSFGSDETIGPHHAVAKAIANTIRNEENSGMALALNGDWGSGKSSVIRMLKREVREDKDKIIVFEFDGWEHQGENLRRSFLAKLIRFLLSEICEKQEDYWQEKLDDLGKQITKGSSQPMITEYGFCIGNFIFIAGFIFAMLNIINGTCTKLTLYILSFIALLPVFYSVWHFYIKNTLYPNGSNQSAISKTETKSVIEQLPEPSSIEFQKDYVGLIEDVLISNKRKLVIVFDNLDRVEPKRSMEIWATMRSFTEIHSQMFDRFGNKKPDKLWLKQLWFLVPFEFAAIDDIWKDITKTSNKNSIARGFTDKIFQAFFRTPPISLESWSEYLIKCLEKGFTGFTQESFPDEHHRIYKVLSNINKLRNRPVTPRDVIRFVNDMIVSYDSSILSETPDAHARYLLSLRRFQTRDLI